MTAPMTDKLSADLLLKIHSRRQSCPIVYAALFHQRAAGESNEHTMMVIADAALTALDETKKAYLDHLRRCPVRALPISEE